MEDATGDCLMARSPPGLPYQTEDRPGKDSAHSKAPSREAQATSDRLHFLLLKLSVGTSRSLQWASLPTQRPQSCQSRFPLSISTGKNRRTGRFFLGLQISLPN